MITQLKKQIIKLRSYNPREKNKQPAKEGFFNVSKRENWLL